MMRMSGRVTGWCVGLFLTLTSVSALQRLNSINDLKKINFGQSVPSHSLLLLHWFANIIHIDNNNVVLLTFDPNNEDYGSHHYGNYEGMLDPLSHGYRYYTVGNLNHQTSDELPDHVIDPWPEYNGRNLDRIIFRVRGQRSHAVQRIDQVYITQHYPTSEHQGTRYDPDHTYQVTTNLLREIREFPMEANQHSLSELRARFGSNADDSQLRDIKNRWGNLACLGLLLFIVLKEKSSSKQSNNRPQRSARRQTQPDFVINIPENRLMEADVFARSRQDQRDELQLAVTTGRKGNARIHWNNIPKHRLKNKVMAVLFKSNGDQEASRTYKCIDTESGSFDTSVPLNEGLQARLHTVRRRCYFWKVVGEEICRGPEFTLNNTTVNITGYDARLQLFVKDGKACARIFIKKSFIGWRSEFAQSWVGFYTSAYKATNQYEWWQWQWVTKFSPSTDSEDFYSVYEYHSGMTIAPGVQARFILRDGEAKACTPIWWL